MKQEKINSEEFKIKPS